MTFSDSKEKLVGFRWQRVCVYSEVVLVGDILVFANKVKCLFLKRR